MKAKRMLIVIAAIALVATLVSAVACNKHTHEYTKWAHNDTQHWKVCPTDNEEEPDSRADHNYVDGACECGATSPHEHNYTKWANNGTQHWKVCPDDNVADTNSYANHVYDQEDNTKCVCGAEKPCDHDYTGQPYVKDTANPGKHYQVCTKCQQPGASVSCTFNYSASETAGKHTATCPDCGYDKEEDHDFAGQTNVPDNQGNHYKLCKKCEQPGASEQCSMVLESRAWNNHTYKCSSCENEEVNAHNNTGDNGLCTCGYSSQWFVVGGPLFGDETDAWAETTTTQERILDDEGDGFLVNYEFEFSGPTSFKVKSNMPGWEFSFGYSDIEFEEMDPDYAYLFEQGEDNKIVVKYACNIVIMISLEDNMIILEVNEADEEGTTYESVSASFSVQVEAIALPAYVYENKEF